MQYALLIYEKPGADDAFSPEELRELSGEYLAIRDDPRVVGGGRLQPADTARTVRVQDGAALVTDGPFADTKEVFGGYFLVETDDPEAALAVASMIPAARLGGSVEIRPMEKPER